jgi:hypothetical protein
MCRSVRVHSRRSSARRAPAAARNRVTTRCAHCSHTVRSREKIAARARRTKRARNTHLTLTHPSAAAFCFAAPQASTPGTPRAHVRCKRTQADARARLAAAGSGGGGGGGTPGAELSAPRSGRKRCACVLRCLCARARADLWLACVRRRRGGIGVLSPAGVTPRALHATPRAPPHTPRTAPNGGGFGGRGRAAAADAAAPTPPGSLAQFLADL